MLLFWSKIAHEQASAIFLNFKSECFCFEP